VKFVISSSVSYGRLLGSPCGGRSRNYPVCEADAGLARLFRSCSVKDLLLALNHQTASHLSSIAAPRDAQAEVIPAARALGVGIIAWGPLGAGALTDRWQTRDDMPPHDRRRRLPRFSEDNFHQVGPGKCETATVTRCDSAELVLGWWMYIAVYMMPTS